MHLNFSLPKMFVNTTKSKQIVNEIQLKNNTEYARFPLKSSFCDILAKNTVYFHTNPANNIFFLIFSLHNIFSHDNCPFF